MNVHLIAGYDLHRPFAPHYAIDPVEVERYEQEKFLE